MEQIILVVLCAITRMMPTVEGLEDEYEICRRAKPATVPRNYWDCNTTR